MTVNNDVLYCGWITTTYVKDGVYTTTKEWKQWRSYCDLVSKYIDDNLVEFKISVGKEGYKL